MRFGNNVALPRLPALGDRGTATAADLWLGTSDSASVTPKSLYDAGAEVTITYAATATIDFSKVLNGLITLTGNLTLANPSNLKLGQSGVIRLVQDATGSRTLSLGSNWKCATGAPTATTTANAIDALSYLAVTPTIILCWLSKAHA